MIALLQLPVRPESADDATHHIVAVAHIVSFSEVEGGGSDVVTTRFTIETSLGVDTICRLIQETAVCHA